MSYKGGWALVVVMWGVMTVQGAGAVMAMGGLWRSMRSVGMGGGGVAHPDPIGSVVTNPAGLANPASTTEWATHSLTPDFGGGSRTVVRWGSVGYANISLDEGGYRSVIWAYGRRGSRWLDWGIRVQQWPTVNGAGWSTDFGVVGHISPHFRWGGVVSKWIQSQPLGASTGQVGLAWVGDNQEWVWVLDGESNSDQIWEISTGIEWQLASDWWVRGGLNARAWTAGMGLLWGPMMVDYAVEKAPQWPPHHVLSIRWGGGQADSKLEEW